LNTPQLLQCSIVAVLPLLPLLPLLLPLLLLVAGLPLPSFFTDSAFLGGIAD